MTDGTESRCDECGQAGRVFVEHATKVCGKWNRWRECPRCWAEANERAFGACGQAERAGVA